jgi:hypothetical protein
MEKAKDDLMEKVHDVILYYKMENCKNEYKKRLKIQKALKFYEHCTQFRDRLVRDINRDDGWGIHGNHAVDDDYFMALEYVVEELDRIMVFSCEDLEIK